jgi:hypothetical protein
MGAMSDHLAERLKWFWRADKSGAERLPPDAVTLEIPIELPNPHFWFRYKRLSDGRWIVHRVIRPEELGYREVFRTPCFIQYQPPSPSEQIYPPVKPGIHQIEVDMAEVIRDLERAGIPIPTEMADAVRIWPRWDLDSRTLWYGETICRHYLRRNAPNQFAVLNAFQAANWPRSIDSPFGTVDRALRETIDEMNKLLTNDSPIRFGIEARKPIWFIRVAPASSG